MTEVTKGGVPVAELYTNGVVRGLWIGIQEIRRIMDPAKQFAAYGDEDLDAVIADLESRANTLIDEKKERKELENA